MPELDILCVTPSSSGGWGPITAMARLAGTLFATEPTVWHPHAAYGHARKAASLLPQARRGERALLLIASHPGDLLALARPSVILGRYNRVGAWIIDSFWDDRLPMFARRHRQIDMLWITDRELIGQYEEATDLTVGWLPWGSDTMAAWRHAHDDSRGTDVLRLGRQPEAWDDDDTNARALAGRGLTYAGRFPDAGSGLLNQEQVRLRLADAKVVLASSALASPSDYTHPTHDYISGRFTDAAAAGTRVLGRPPRCAAADLLPTGLLVPMAVNTQASGLEIVAEAVAAYNPDDAHRLRREAMAKLDWRHRFAQIATSLELHAPLLDAELQRLNTMMGAPA